MPCDYYRASRRLCFDGTQTTVQEKRVGFDSNYITIRKSRTGAKISLQLALQ
jgi:hypothetical protein